MKYRGLDENKDMVFGGNAADFLTGIEAVAQACRTRMLLLLGEWWEDTEDGLPLWQSIAGHRDRDIAKKLIHDRLQKTKGVIAVTNLNAIFDPKNRILSISADVDTEFGAFSFEFNSSEVL